ncbi:hypothetical protein CLF_113241 [Clonorchis sinensis]|uniref:WRKY domain-containing protein n=1 Tax=Clonorchis sinensis TaxID=79923 RepID=G7YXZ3_CLOSI|nr:hypothetical protein CLF_113241 [Clonorchis sinensis]
MAENVLSLKAVDDFVEKLVRPRFFSFSGFQIALREYMTNNFVVFVRINSQKSSDSKLLYEKAFYRCSRWPCRQSQGRGIRRSYTRCTGCPARLHVRRYNDHLMVTSYYLEHNHPRSKFIFDRLPVNRRLATEELKECSTLLKYGAPSSEIRQYVTDHFGKVLTIQDVYNYRVKCRPPLSGSIKHANINDRVSRVKFALDVLKTLLLSLENAILRFCASSLVNRSPNAPETYLLSYIGFVLPLQILLIDSKSPAAHRIARPSPIISNMTSFTGLSGNRNENDVYILHIDKFFVRYSKTGVQKTLDTCLNDGRLFRIRVVKGSYHPGFRQIFENRSSEDISYTPSRFQLNYSPYPLFRKLLLNRLVLVCYPARIKPPLETFSDALCVQQKALSQGILPLLSEQVLKYLKGNPRRHGRKYSNDDDKDTKQIRERRKFGIIANLGYSKYELGKLILGIKQNVVRRAVIDAGFSVKDEDDLSDA